MNLAARVAPPAPSHEADEGHGTDLGKHQADDSRRSRPEGEPDADLSCPSHHARAEHSIEADDDEDERDQREERRERRQRPVTYQRVVDQRGLQRDVRRGETPGVYVRALARAAFKPPAFSRVRTSITAASSGRYGS